MASPTQWTWVWVDSGIWWWTGRPGVLRFRGSHRVGHDWMAELNWTELFSSISLHWSLRKAFLSLLAILWKSAFRWIYLSFSPLPFTSLLFSTLYKASSDNHFDFLHFFFLGMVLITDSCTMLRISVHSSSGSPSDLISWKFCHFHCIVVRDLI